MIDIYGSHFEFGGISSQKYGLVFANISTNRFTQLAGSVKSITAFNKKNKRSMLIGTDFNDSPLSFDIEIITDGAQRLSSDKYKEIEKWLFNHRNYRKLYFGETNDSPTGTYEYVDGVKVRYYLNCRLVNPEKIESGDGIIGYKATLEADAGWLHTDNITKNYTISNALSDSTAVIKVEIDTEIDDYIYPKVTLQTGDVGGNIIITNNTDSAERLTKFVEIPANSTIIMNGELNYINNQFYEKLHTRNFIRLLDGENNFTVIGNVSSVKFEYSVRRML